jgi:cellulose synthase/poly-beta-1,6-N-acetylglucosamine synthase-like glycosyltransferase
MEPVSLLALIAAAAVALPVAVLALECLAAVLAGERSEGARLCSSDPRPSVVVLIPAHDEEHEIETTLRSILGEVEPHEILVVAHNCHDRTASLARSLGVRVLEVEDGGAGGKPDAMRAGLAEFTDDPPDVVVTLDADCTVTPRSIEILTRVTRSFDRPVQATYLFDDPRDPSTVQYPSTMQSVSRLALLVKNYVRPLGMHRLGLPCLLNGSGSAFPFRLIRDALRSEGGIVEDRVFSIDLALAGYPTRFCPEARVWSRLPEGRGSALEQRRRWEHGNLHLLLTRGPLLVAKGILSARPGLFFLGLDILVPPLALLAFAWGITAILAVSAYLLAGAISPLGVAGSAGALLLISVLSAGVRFQGGAETLRLLIAIPLYVLWKLPLYATYILRREKRWIRTARDANPSAERGGRGNER